MNCKPGDLAVITRACNDPHLIGTVVKLTLPDEWLGFWKYEETPTLLAHDGRAICALRDAYLTPIRDNGGEDETLTWAGKPQQIKETS